jgi:putative lipoprotein
MKMRAMILSIAGLILSGCFSTDEIKLEDIRNFKITVNEAKGNRQVHLTGLLGNSAMGISDIKTTSRNDELNIVLFQKIAGSDYSGALDKEIPLASSIQKIIYGSEHKVIWQD